jgi:hypothetical protein
MGTVTSVIALEWVAKRLGEDQELLEEILCNSDNLTYGSIITVHVGPDQTITTLTQDGVQELSELLADARRSADEWESFLNSCLLDPDLIRRFKNHQSR